jgi:cell division transport system permease protein
MVKLRIWIYYWKHALANIMGNRLINVITVGTITISLLLLGAFMLFYLNLSNWVMEWGQSLSMSVYLKDGIDEKTLKGVEKALRKLPGAQIKDFVSKEQAMMDMTDALGAQAGLLKGFRANPFPASFEIVFKEVSQGRVNPQIMKQDLETIGGVEEVQYSEQWLERLEGLIYIVKLAGLVIGGLLCIAVLFIIANTIKLTIYSRRDEMDIFKLVGATDWFVRMPFLLEGAVQGLLGGLISLVILFLLYSLISLKTVRVFGLPVMDIVFLTDRYVIIVLGLSLLLGLTGSFIAIGRFFRS